MRASAPECEDLFSCSVLFILQCCAPAFDMLCLAINPRDYENRRQLPWKILRLRNYGAQQVRGRKKVNKSKTYQPLFTLWRLEGAARAYGLGLGWDLWFKSYAAVCSSNNNTNTLTTLRDALKIETIETQCIWWCQMTQSWIFQLTFLATFLITG